MRPFVIFKQIYLKDKMMKMKITICCKDQIVSLCAADAAGDFEFEMSSISVTNENFGQKTSFCF